MRLNRTSEWKVMTIWIYESFRCSISSVWKCDVPESNTQVKSYDHLNISRASVVQFRASRIVMRMNRTFEWKLMTIWISRELSVFNFEGLDMWCAWIGHPSKKLSPFEFLESFRFSISSVSLYYAAESNLRVKGYDHLNFSRASVVQFRASRNVMRLNRTSEWKVMTIWIYESFRCSISSVSIYYASESDQRVKSYDHLNFSRAFVV